VQRGILAQAVSVALQPQAQALQLKSAAQVVPAQWVPLGQEKHATPLSPQVVLVFVCSQAPAASQHPFVQSDDVQAGQLPGNWHELEVVHHVDPAGPHATPQPS
jgi:hypothetical protein